MSFIGQNDLFLLRISHLKLLDELTVLWGDHLTPRRKFVETLTFYHNATMICILLLSKNNEILYLHTILTYELCHQQCQANYYYYILWYININNIYTYSQGIKTFPFLLDKEIQHKSKLLTLTLKDLALSYHWHPILISRAACTWQLTRTYHMFWLRKNTQVVVHEDRQL